MGKARHLAVLLFVVLAICASILLAKDKRKLAAANATTLDAHQRAVHALNRLTFGPRPGDVETVERIGVDKWIEQQLHPEKIDDSALQARLENFRTLRTDTRKMLEDFPPPQVAKAVIDGKLAIPSDPARRAIYEAQIERQRNRQEKKQASVQPGTQATGANPDTQSVAVADTRASERREQREFANERAQSLIALAPEARYQEILKMNPGDREILVQRLSEVERYRLIADMRPEQRETIMALANPVAVVQGELTQAKLLRAIYSQRQLEEVMTDFWFNHFNVFIGKGADRYLVTSYERDVIRPHALGKFKDLLLATAKSPAMLFYLDNWMSVGPNSKFAQFGPERPQPAPRAVYRRPWGRWGPPVVVMRQPRPRPPRRAVEAKKARTGLNENYARELMELHTLGVNGGYTQHDVTEVACAFTGWTVKEPRKGGDFEFDERKHEPGTKYILGHKIKEHGQKEGEEVLDVLAHSPATARFISTGLAQRFVSDNPPQSLIDRMTKTFQAKDGDIREVLRTLFQSPEFWSQDVYRTKVKTPLEFVASAVRASGSDVTNAMPLVQALNRMGMPLYGAQPPTGYKTDAQEWVNSAALLNRMNFALALASGRMPGISVAPEAIVGSATQYQGDPLPMLENALLSGDISKQTHETIRKQMDDPDLMARTAGAGTNSVKPALATALILGSPEFQKK